MGRTRSPCQGCEHCRMVKKGKERVRICKLTGYTLPKQKNFPCPTGRRERMIARFKEARAGETADTSPTYHP